MKRIATLLGLASLSLLAACAPQQTITRVPVEATTDVDYRFNDNDARLVWQGMVDDTTFRGWIDRWLEAHQGKKPIIIVGDIANNTQDYINMNLFTRNFEREMLNSGRVRIVAMRDQRGQIRDERFQGEQWNTPETRKALRMELGADLILIGDVNDNKQRDPSGRQLINYYQVNLDMTDLESNEKMWIGSVEIKKVVRR